MQAKKVIIYPTDEGGVAIIIPTPEYLAYGTLEDLAAQQVPEGKPHQIISVSELPKDRLFRDAWEYV
jgi:hypothetical protein